MKIIKVLLIILGILLLVGGAAAAIILLTAGENFRCKDVAISDKEYKDSIIEWQAAKVTPRENHLQKMTEGRREVYLGKLRSCDEAKSEKNIGTIVSVIVAGIGFLLTIVGFFVGRKKALT